MAREPRRSREKAFSTGRKCSNGLSVSTPEDEVDLEQSALKSIAASVCNLWQALRPAIKGRTGDDVRARAVQAVVKTL